MRRPALRVRRFDCNGPRLPVRPEAERAHFTVNPDKGVCDPVVAQGLGQPVHAIALGDAVEIERDGRGLAHLVATDLQHLMRRAARGVHRGADAIRRGGLRPEAPGRHRVAHADVEGPARGAPDLEAKAQDLSKVFAGTATHSPTGAALSRIRSLSGFQVDICPSTSSTAACSAARIGAGSKSGSREEQRRPARAHGRAVQGVPHALSRHLRHTAPPPSELPA